MNKKRTSIIWTMTREEFLDVVENSNSISEILRSLSLSISGGSFKILKERLLLENVDLQRFKDNHLKNSIKNLKKLTPLEEILVENSTYNWNSALKKRLIKEHLLDEKCYKCGLPPIWNGEELTLVLDHINGKNNDNRLINLRLLCPNCHSQTPTFAGRNVKRELRCCKLCNGKISKGAALCINCFNLTKKNNPQNSTSKVQKKKAKKSFCIACNKPIYSNSKHCWDCYKQLAPNFAKKVLRPSKEELEELIRTTPFIHIAEQYGVSDNAVRKWCKYYGLPFRRKEIEEYFKQLTT